MTGRGFSGKERAAMIAGYKLLRADRRTMRITAGQRAFLTRLLHEPSRTSPAASHMMRRRRRFPLGGRLHRLWRHHNEAWHGLWLWRPLCWLDGGHSDDSYGSCVVCFKALRRR